MSYNKFIKDVAIISFTQLLVNLSSFILLPIITKILGVFDYGVWSQLIVTVGLLSSLASLSLSSAFIRFFSSKTDKKEISKGFFSIFFFVILLSFLIILIVIFFSIPISLFLFNTRIYSTLIQIASFIIVLNVIYTLVLSYFRIYQQMLVYTGLTVFTSVGQMILAIFLLIVLRYGIDGVVFSVLFSYFFPLVFSFGIIIKQVGFSNPSFSEIPKYIIFSLPLVPNALIMWIINSSDRYIVGFFLGTISVGMYSAAYGIGYLVYLFVTPLQIILLPQLTKLYDNGKINEVKTYISYSLKFFLLIAIPSVVGLTVLAEQILILLTTIEFVKGSMVIPLIAISALFAGLVQIFININLLYKKTKLNFWIQIIPALLNIAFNFILIPVIGFIGAAIATLLAFLIMFITVYIVITKFLQFNIDINFILKIILSSIILGIFVFLLKDKINLILLTLFGIIIYAVFCFVFKIFSKQEMSFFKNILRFSKHSN